MVSDEVFNSLEWTNINAAELEASISGCEVCGVEPIGYPLTDGIFIFSDTLGGFFGAEQVKEVWQHLRAQNKERKLYFDLEQVIKTATEKELKEYCRVWEEAKQNESNDPEIIKRVLDLLRREQKQRTKQPRLTMLLKNVVGVKSE